ncbi:MAG: glycosyltransferase [Candidatus Bathyarchaeales archaeon]
MLPWPLVLVLLFLWAILIMPQIAYYILVSRKGKKPWNIIKSCAYFPRVSLVVATYNEAAVICEKLKNIQRLNYPKDKLQVIVVDSGSDDGTLNLCNEFLAKTTFPFEIKLISEQERYGKSHALNTALMHADGEIIATSDADAFWESDALRNAVSFFADKRVGAVTGKEKIINLNNSIHTLSEGLYRKFYYYIRLGESKIHSTLIFQGELALYRRSAFVRFEDKAGYADDTGTIVNILSNGYRCIFVPDAIFYDAAAVSLKGKLTLKSRRAQHLVAGLILSMKLKLVGKLPIPFVIVFFNFYMHVISPILLITALSVSVTVYFLYFHVVWWLGILAFPFLLVKKLRLFLVSYVTGNLALIAGLLRHIGKRRSKVWRKVDEMRNSRFILDVGS